jgi:hypothetical protein
MFSPNPTDTFMAKFDADEGRDHLLFTMQTGFDV